MKKIVEINIRVREICWNMKPSVSKLDTNSPIYKYEYEENTWYLLSLLLIQKYRTYSISKYDTN